VRADGRGRPAGNRAADDGSDAGSGHPSAIVPLDAPPAVDAPGTESVTCGGISDHEWLRRAVRRQGHLTAYVVVVGHSSQRTRRAVYMTLGGARNAARRARSRGHDVEVRLVFLTTLADVEVPT